MARHRTARRRRSGWLGWAGSRTEQLIDEELAIIVEHHGYWISPDARSRR